MSDILDSIDDLEDGGADYASSDSTEVVEVDDSMVSQIDTIIENSAMMNAEEAQELTIAIKSTSTALYILLARAHEGKAYKALGYDTWKEYVQSEFDISPQRSYQLLDQHKVISALEEAAPEGTVVKLTEAEARSIKKELPRITDEIKSATEGKSADEAESLIDDMINEKRAQQKEDKKALELKEKNLQEAEQDGYHKGLEAAADALLDQADEKGPKQQNDSFSPDSPDYMTDSADGEFIEVDVKGSSEPSVNPTTKYALQNFASIITTIDGMPEPSVLVDAIPESRLPSFIDQIAGAQGWINRFATLAEARQEELHNS